MIFPSASSHWRRLAALSLVALVGACSGSGESAEATPAGARDDPGSSNQLFTRLSSSATGIRFENRLKETNELNVFTYRNFYNGGGVGLGDFTAVGLPDILLTSIQGGPRLYLNQGHFLFRDITSDSGVTNENGTWT